ncbi:conserved hypothetical protein [Neospora caninum Liverpool]|uniref:Choline transporter-like protein 4 n=1 Tax=Neospora caninum (strain Liverpool) TaxID=572307 RepID=F0VD03_NEOCL|nr:conserved hypothetical protein [Neospora caninum Liverpool]CBZ51518.1 conserved hypothetical protein [Neospora caninum Liverpool]CEL65467.1 TPA: Choline transporter-like protein 4 [Neospora caninum Liverpool]|eukprot:XP_003881551.1 conserved hypothetical protein [Neospora caninum Liverpool]
MPFYSYAVDSSLGRDRSRDEGPGAQGSTGAASSPSAGRDRRLSASRTSGQYSADCVDGEFGSSPSLSSFSPSIRWGSSAPTADRHSHPRATLATAAARSSLSSASLSSLSQRLTVVNQQGTGNPFAPACAPLDFPGDTETWNDLTGRGPSPNLPRDVEVLGASSVHSLAASTCYDGASSALFYPNVRLASAPQNPFALHAGTAGDRGSWGRREQPAALIGRAQVGDFHGPSPDLAGESSLAGLSRANGRGAIGDRDAYFAEDETPDLHSPADTESHGSYQPPRLSQLPAPTSAPLRTAASVALSSEREWTPSVSSRLARRPLLPARDAAAASPRAVSASSLGRRTSSSPSTPARSYPSEDLSEWYVSWEHPFLKRSPLDVSRGPLPQRRCTDLFFLVLLLLAWFAVAAALALRLAPGASPVARLSAGIDWKGRTCGHDPGVEDFPLVYWPAKQQPETPINDELSACSIIPVCTKACPDAFSARREKGACSSDAESAGLCSWYSSGPAALLLRRYCLFVGADGKAKDHGLLSSWIRWVADIDIAWPLVVVAPTAALLLGYLFLWLLQKAAHAVVAGLVLLLEILLLGAAYEFYCAYAASRSLSSYTHPFDRSYPVESAFVSQSTHAANPVSSSLSSSVTKSVLVAFPLTVGSGAGNLALVCLCCVAALLIAFFSVFFRRELQVSTSVLTASAMLLQQAPRKFLLLLPLAAAAALASHGALVVAAVSHLLALGPIPMLPISACIPTLSPWVRLPLLSGSSIALLLSLLFVALWTGGFLNAVSRMVVAYYASAWYFMPRHMHDRRESLKAKAVEAAKVVFSYHLGSAALGGLILSSVQMLKLLFGWARYRAVRRNQSAFKRVVYRLSNCVACLYTPFKFVTPTAFIFVALLGQPLLQASWTAIATLTRNPVATAFVWQIGWLLQLVGQLSISICVAWCTYTLLPMFPSTYSQLSSLGAPVVLSFILSLYVASVCVHVFGLAADTLLQAFLADREMSLQDGKFTAEHAPASLRTLDRYMLRNRASQGRMRRV